MIDWPLVSDYAGAFAFGYLCGSIPFGIVFTRLTNTADPRSVGSGNIGATNVLRTGRKGLALATLLGDALKGTFAVLVVGAYSGADQALTTALGAFLGHLFPVWLRFKGGKGVATYLGLLIGLAWPVAIAFGLIWLAVAALSRYSSLSALAASAATPPLIWFTDRRREALLFLALTALLWCMHRANISRLIAGTEAKVGDERRH
jgi:glycerol-3-phosphate acyltransferase PlsY